MSYTPLEQVRKHTLDYIVEMRCNEKFTVQSTATTGKTRDLLERDLVDQKRTLQNIEKAKNSAKKKDSDWPELIREFPQRIKQHLNHTTLGEKLRILDRFKDDIKNPNRNEYRKD